MTHEPRGVEPERVARVLGLLGYLLHRAPEQRILISDVQRDLGLTRDEVVADARLLNLVNFGGGTYLLYIEIEEDTLLVERETLAENMESPARLSPTLAQSLVLALELVGSAVAGNPTTARSLRNKLLTALSDSVTKPPVLATSAPFCEPPAELLATLAQAIRDHRLVEIEYYTATRADLRRRTIEPYYLRRCGDLWYLDAFCLTAGNPRTFRIDLVKSAMLTSATFEPRPQLTGDFFPDQDEPMWALLLFDPAREADLRSQGVSYTAQTDGRLLVKTPFFNKAWLVDQVLAGLGTVEICNDEEARTEVAEEARRLLSIYRELSSGFEDSAQE